MDDKSLEILEFPQIRKILAGFTSFSASTDLALNLRPLTDCQRIALLLRQSAEARFLLSVEPGFSASGVLDIRETAKMAARGKVLEAQSLLEIRQTLAATRDLRGSLKKLSDKLPLLGNIAGGIADLQALEKDIAHCLAPTGEVLDRASNRLADIRRQLRAAQHQLLEQLEHLMNSPKGRKIIQDNVVTEREGRYVIPLKIEHRKEIKGIVHDVSNTGATAFVEPWATVELGNTVRELAIGEKHEIESIMRKLSIEVGEHDVEISCTIALAAELDLALAKARYAIRNRATEPVITGVSQNGKPADGEPGAFLRLVQARHPLLGEKAVPLSVEIGKDFSVLVITGPNTGGKTVALKTIGLLSLMAQSGMPIPAAPESSIPVFDDVFADIGDEQSIEQTLSTFSWHMGNIVRIADRATPRSLVLMDELGTSTDPGEGAALARAILLDFLSRGIMTVATTHFSDLKVFAHATPGMRNASLDFDPVTFEPTYHLVVGVPGGSNALATAARLGLAPEIVARARAMLGKGTQELESLLAELRKEQQEAAALRIELQGKANLLEGRKAALEDELQKLIAEEKRTIQQTKDNLLNEASELSREIRRSLSELRREKSREKLAQAEKVKSAVQKQLEKEGWQARPAVKTKADEADKREVAPGDAVRLKETDLQAIVLSVHRETQQVEVQAGQSRFKLSLDSVEKTSSYAGGEGRTTQPPNVRIPARRGDISLELDLRGKRADEIEPVVDRYLNDASLGGLNEARIIHGFGTGAVRQIVRNLVTAHPLVKSFRPGQKGEGGDGVTVVQL